MINRSSTIRSLQPRESSSLSRLDNEKDKPQQKATDLAAPSAKTYRGGRATPARRLRPIFNYP